MENYIEIARKNIINAKYSQIYRSKENYYDCSSFVCRTLKEAGYNINPLSNTSSMPNELKKIGFIQLPFDKNNLEEGDILWRRGHTEIYTGDGKSIGAHSSKSGVSERNMFDRNGRDYMGYTHIFRKI